MKALKVLLICFLAAAAMGFMAGEIFAETRTLTTMIMITVKPAEPAAAKAPTGLEDLYKTALTQSIQARIVKVEEPIHTPTGLARYTMSERL